MFETLCQTVHDNLIAGKCPWCGREVTEGQAIGPAPESLGDLRADIHAAIASLFRTHMPTTDDRAEKDELKEAIEDFFQAYFESKQGPSKKSEPEAPDDLSAAIERCGANTSQAIRLLCEALRNDDPFVRLEAVIELGRIGPDAKSSLPALFMLIDDKDQSVRDAAAEAIRMIDR